MRIKLLVDDPRLSEFAGVVLLLLAFGLLLSLVSYSPDDPSVNVATDAGRASNWMGLPGSYCADLILQSLGLAGLLLPVALAAAGWRRVRSRPGPPTANTVAGSVILGVTLCAVLQLLVPDGGGLVPAGWRASVQPGGAFGRVFLDVAVPLLNLGGTILLLLCGAAVSIYLLTSWHVSDFFRRRKPDDATAAPDLDWAEPAEDPDLVPITEGPGVGASTGAGGTQAPAPPAVNEPRADGSGTEAPSGAEPPIVPLDQTAANSASDTLLPDPTGGRSAPRVGKPTYALPRTSILNAPYGEASYDEEELQGTARRIVEKLQEFGVGGSVEQINPGPVVTTFEFKPDRGVKVAKITNLSEDLCLSLECESILVERIPGRPTVGIEVPNRKREVISLREVVDSAAFQQSSSMLTFALGKDINGKIHCTDLAGMPHLLVAGQTGSGKSVMVNSVIMSILLRATPEDVRFILVDPKTVELALYRDVPHLLTPVITDMKQATNALRNATKEMARRLQLLSQFGVRNIAQFNERVAQGKLAAPDGDEVEKLPYIVVIVDELADLMMLAGRQIEESIQRLAQMARAVGIHLILATQRPSVDVITGLIKANIPARLSFLLATRVDSRTILDSMGAESLLGKGDMLFLPPGAPRMRRLHGPLVSENEIEAIVTHWKDLASPQYETDYLQAPDGEQQEADGDDDGASDDPLYRDAVRLVLEMGKASTSTLQRRLRLGYGRAARILDAMEQDGIIGPSDGSRPREVLKRPDWLDEAAGD